LLVKNKQGNNFQIKNRFIKNEKKKRKELKPSLGSKTIKHQRKKVNSQLLTLIFLLL